MIADHVYVTTIKPNEIRRDSICQQLADIPFEFFNGLDMTQSLLEYEYVSHFPEEVLNHYHFERETARIWSKGQFGCYATFISILRDAQQKNYKQILFIEDDAIFQKNWQLRASDAMKQLPADWDMFLLGTKYGNAAFRYKRPLIKLKQIVTGKSYSLPQKYSSLLDIPSSCFIGIYAALISNNGINKLLQHCYKSAVQGDSLMGKLVLEKKLNIFSIYPLVVKEGNFGSYTPINNF